MTTVNKEFIRDKLIPFIKKEAENEKFDMAMFFSDTIDFGKYFLNEKPSCETAACIAGSVVLLEIDKFREKYPKKFGRTGRTGKVVYSRGKSDDYSKFSAEILGINERFASELFLGQQAFSDDDIYTEADVNPQEYAMSCFGIYNGTCFQDITSSQVIGVLEEMVNGRWDEQASR